MTAQYQLFPELTADEYAALKADIAERGVLVPVELDEAGNILDGHHRLRAWTELKSEGVKVGDYPRVVRAGWTEEQKRNHVRKLNLLRRHLDKAKRDSVIADMLKDGMSTREVAQAIGVSNATAQRAGVTNVTPEDAPIRVNGRDGKSYPAKQKKRERPPVSIFAGSAQQEKQAITAAQHIDIAPDKVIDVKRAERIAREQENARMREEPEPVIVATPGADIRHGNFTDVLADVPDDSVRLIFTDPPYSKEFLPLWSDLAQFASRVLMPGGLMIAYSGQSYLPTVIASLTKHLQYVWIAAQLSKTAKTIIHQPKVYSAWKPLLIFAKPPYEPATWIDDVVGGTGPEKDGHDWQQAEAEAEYYIKQLTSQGDTVVDPFIGSGTTAAAAMKLGRLIICSDIDIACIKRTTERLRHE